MAKQSSSSKLLYPLMLLLAVSLFLFGISVSQFGLLEKSKDTYKNTNPFNNTNEELDTFVVKPGAGVDTVDLKLVADKNPVLPNTDVVVNVVYSDISSAIEMVGTVLTIKVPSGLTVKNIPANNRDTADLPNLVTSYVEYRTVGNDMYIDIAAFGDPNGGVLVNNNNVLYSFTVGSGSVGLKSISFIENENIPVVTTLSNETQVLNVEGLASLQLDVKNQTVETPVITPNGGEQSDTVQVSITSQNNSTIKYTLDGTNPKTSNTAVSVNGNNASFNLTKGPNVKVSAYAYQPNYLDSSIATADFNFKVANLVLDPAPQNDAFVGPITLKASTPTNGATIYYTTDGSTPTTSSSQLTSSGITLNETTVVKFLATKDGYTPVSATNTYFVEIPNEKPSVGVTSPVSGAQIYKRPTSFTFNTSDSDGEVREIGFMQNNVSLVKSTTDMTKLNWTPTSAGVLNLQAYAKDNDGATTVVDYALTVFNVGDVNKDGKFTLTGDLIPVIKALFGADSQNVEAMDVDLDGKVMISDVIEIIKLIYVN